MGRKQTIQRNYDDEGNLISKECNICHEVKPVSEFSKNKGKIDGYQLKCKECTKQYDKKYREENKNKLSEQSKQYYEDNKERINEYQKQYRENNKEIIKKRGKQYRENNKDKLKQYREENRDKINERQKQYAIDNAEHIKKYKKEYAIKNKDKIRKYKREHYEKNIDKKKEYDKQYREDNKEKLLEQRKQYYENNKEYLCKQNKQRRQEQIQEALQQIKTEVEKNPDKYNYIEDKEIYGIIYLVHNIESDKYYVGQTINSFDIRYPSGWLYEHDYKDTVKHDLQLYGINSFKYTKIFKVAYSQYELDKLEAYYIDYYNSYENGYNENRGYIFTDRGKEK